MSTLTEVYVRCNGFGGGRQRSDDLNIVRWLFSGDARGGDILPWWGVNRELRLDVMDASRPEVSHLATQSDRFLAAASQKFFVPTADDEEVRFTIK